MGLLQESLNLIDASIAAHITNSFVALSAAIMPSIRNFLILSFILFGIAIWRGVIEYPLKEFLKKIIVLSIIFAFIQNWAIYNGYLVDVLLNSPDAIAGILVGAPAGITALLDGGFDQGFAAADAAYEKGNTFSGPILWLFIVLFNILLMVTVVVLVGGARIALAVLLVLGPLFFVFLFFTPTKKMFESWLQQILNYGFVIILTFTVLTLTGVLFGNAVAKLETTPSLSETSGMVTFVFVCLLIFALLKQVPTIASSLAGGMQMHTLGASRAVRQQAGSAFRSLGNVNIRRPNIPWKKNNTVTL